MKQIDYELKPIDDMNPDEVHYLIDYTDSVSSAFTNTANQMYEKANETVQDLSAQLMLLGTVILSGILITLGSTDLIKSVSSELKLITLIIFVLQVVSIIAGILSYKNREAFFANAADVAKDTSIMVKKRDYKNLAEMGKEIEDLKQKKSKSRELAQSIQSACIIISLVLFFAFITGVLFDIPFYR